MFRLWAIALFFVHNFIIPSHSSICFPMIQLYIPLVSPQSRPSTVFSRLLMLFSCLSLIIEKYMVFASSTRNSDSAAIKTLQYLGNWVDII